MNKIKYRVALVIEKVDEVNGLELDMGQISWSRVGSFATSDEAEELVSYVFRKAHDATQYNPDDEVDELI